MLRHHEKAVAVSGGGMLACSGTERGSLTTKRMPHQRENIHHNALAAAVWTLRLYHSPERSPSRQDSHHNAFSPNGAVIVRLHHTTMLIAVYVHTVVMIDV